MRISHYQCNIQIYCEFQLDKMLFLSYKAPWFLILYIIIYAPIKASTRILPTENVLPRKYQKPSRQMGKNEVTGVSNIKQVCMDVCSPPYYSQEYPSYQYNNPSQNGQYGQHYPSNNNYYGYQNPSHGGNEQYYPYISYEYYYPGCYRDMFRQRFKFDPGNQEPKISNYKKRINKRKKNLRNKRNYNNNYRYDFMNCQLICYPVVAPQTITTASTQKPNPTKATTTESTESSEADVSTKKPTGSGSTAKTTEGTPAEIKDPSEASEVTMLPPEKPSANNSVPPPVEATILPPEKPSSPKPSVKHGKKSRKHSTNKYA